MPKSDNLFRIKNTQVYGKSKLSKKCRVKLLYDAPAISNNHHMVNHADRN